MGVPRNESGLELQPVGTIEELRRMFGNAEIASVSAATIRAVGFGIERRLAECPNGFHCDLASQTSPADAKKHVRKGRTFNRQRTWRHPHPPAGVKSSDFGTPDRPNPPLQIQLVAGGRAEGVFGTWRSTQSWTCA